MQAKRASFYSAHPRVLLLSEYMVDAVASFSDFRSSRVRARLPLEIPVFTYDSSAADQLHLLPMADSSHLNESARHPFYNRQSLQNPNDPKYNHPSIEELIFQQNTSTSSQQRHDSLLSCSSLANLRHSSSVHQAESQPCPCTLNDHTTVPIGSCMARTTSQYSPSSSGQRPHPRDMHRKPSNSAELGLPYDGLNLPHSYSATSQTLDTMSQPFSTLSPLQSANWYPSRSSDVPSNTSYERTVTNALNMYQFDVADIMGGGSLGANENGVASLGLRRQTSE